MNYEEQIKEYIDSSISLSQSILKCDSENSLLPVYISAFYTAICMETFRNNDLSKEIMEFSIINYCATENINDFYFEIVEDFIEIITNEEVYIGKSLIIPNYEDLNNRLFDKINECPSISLLMDFLHCSVATSPTALLRLADIRNKEFPISNIQKQEDIEYYQKLSCDLSFLALNHFLFQYKKIQELYKEYEKTLVDTSLLILNTIKDMVDTEIETRQTQQTNKKTSKFRTPKAKKAILKSGFFGVIFGILITLFIHSVAGESLNIGYYFAIFIVTVFFTIVARISLLSCD